MTNYLFKFPSTPHLALLGEVNIRDDKVMSKKERDDFLKKIIVVEEKMDGANLGVSFDSTGNVKTQNRGSYISEPFTGQWKTLSGWLSKKVDTFFDVLFNRYMLFGEWCYARHSIQYNRLPDWFLGFDVFDKQNRCFYSSARRNDMFQRLDIASVPIVDRGRFSIRNLIRLMANSNFGDNPAEGIYLRVDDGDYLSHRAKLVRPEFIQTIGEHWSRKNIQANKLSQVIEAQTL